MPTEFVITQACKYRLDEVAERTGLDRDFVSRVWRAAGIPVPDPDQPVLSEEDLEAHEMGKQVLDSGLSEEAYLEISRVVGRAAAP